MFLVPVLFFSGSLLTSPKINICYMFIFYLYKNQILIFWKLFFDDIKYAV